MKFPFEIKQTLALNKLGQFLGGGCYNKIACFVTQVRFFCSRALRQSESGRRPQRFSETLRIIDSAQMRMTKANMEKMEKLDTAVQKLGV